MPALLTLSGASPLVVDQTTTDVREAADDVQDSGNAFVEVTVSSEVYFLNVHYILAIQEV